METEFRREFEICKADDGRRLLFGWACTSTDNGVDVVDGQNEIVEFTALLDGAVEFSKGSRPSLNNHAGKAVGKVLFLLPLDSEIAKSLQITSRFEGLIAGVQVDAATMAAYRAGELSGLSIGGKILEAA